MFVHNETKGDAYFYQARFFFSRIYRPRGRENWCAKIDQSGLSFMIYLITAFAFLLHFRGEKQFLLNFPAQHLPTWQLLDSVHEHFPHFSLVVTFTTFHFCCVQLDCSWCWLKVKLCGARILMIKLFMFLLWLWFRTLLPLCFRSLHVSLPIWLAIIDWRLTVFFWFLSFSWKVLKTYVRNMCSRDITIFDHIFLKHHNLEKK